MWWVVAVGMWNCACVVQNGMPLVVGGGRDPGVKRVAKNLKTKWGESDAPLLAFVWIFGLG